MGTFGCGPLENDWAADAVDRLDDLVESGVPPKEAIKRMLREWGDVLNHGGPDIDHKVLGLVGVCWERGLQVSTALKKAAVAAVNRELEDVDEWQDPEERTQALLDMLNRLGGNIKSSRRPRELKHPEVAFGTLEEAKSTLFKLVDLWTTRKLMDIMAVARVGRSAAGWVELTSDEVEWVVGNVPQFLVNVYGSLEKGTEEAPARVSDHAFYERTMMLACFVGMLLRLEQDEIHGLVNKALAFSKI